MKTISLILGILFILTISAFGEEKEEKIKAQCPKTMMVENCMTCHIAPSFNLKEEAPGAHLILPTGTKILDFGTDKEKGYYLVEDIAAYTPERIMEAFEYFKWHNIKHVVIEIHSYGGSLMSSWRVKGLFDEWMVNGGIVETNVRGVAISGGFIVFVAGTPGYRFANPQAELMWHEISAFSFLKISTPSSTRDEADVLHHLQGTINGWLASRSKMKKEDIERKIQYKEMWLNGQEALELGFVDKLIGE